MKNKTITFLFGAGAEGEGQIGLPSGNGFKRDLILCKDIAQYSNRIIPASYDKRFHINRGYLIQSNSTNVFYQTLMENPFIESLLPENYINDWLEYKDSKIHNSQYSSEDKKEKREKIKKLYKELVFDKLPLYNLPSNGKNESFLDSFLENAGIYSYLDSLFNFLRKPSIYANECKRVMKAYYSAFFSVFNSMNSKASKLDCLDFEYKDINTVFNDNKSVFEIRNDLLSYIDSLQKAISDNVKSNEILYYNKVKLFKNNTGAKVNVVTTNYTLFAQDIIDLSDKQISYPHGKIGLFESVYDKAIKNLNEFSDEEVIFPYVLVQSGVKPIISPVQIEEMAKMMEFINEADYLLIIGYGLNADDEHINTFLKWRLEQGKQIIYFYYDDKAKKNAESILGKNNIKFESTNDFDKVLVELEV